MGELGTGIRGGSYLVSTTHQVEVVLLEELGHHIPSKGVAHTPIVVSPARDVLLWIGPQEVAHEALVWDIGGARHSSYLIHVLKIGRKAAVHTEDLLVNDCSNRHAIETVGECLPKPDVVTPLALIVKAIDAIDAGALVVPAQDEEVFGVFDLVRQEEANGL